MSGTSGLRCLAGSVRRHGVRATDMAGQTVLPWTHLASSAGFQAGETRNFQVIYRDDGLGACGNGTNTTNAISVTYLP